MSDNDLKKDNLLRTLIASGVLLVALIIGVVSHKFANDNLAHALTVPITLMGTAIFTRARKRPPSNILYAIATVFFFVCAIIGQIFAHSVYRYLPF
jgi:hypothetical protein